MSSHPFPITRPRLAPRKPAPIGWDRTFNFFAPRYYKPSNLDETVVGWSRMMNIFCFNDSPWTSILQSLPIEDVEAAILEISRDPDARERKIAAIVAEYVAAGIEDPNALLIDSSPLYARTAASRAVIFAVMFDRLSEDDSPIEEWFSSLAHSAHSMPDTPGLQDMIMNIEVTFVKVNKTLNNGFPDT